MTFSWKGWERASKSRRRNPTENTEEPFIGGPPEQIAKRFGIDHPGRTNIFRHALLIVGLGWLPLALFSAVDDFMFPGGRLAAFFADYGAHARSLIAAPCLVLAQVVTGHRLGALALHLRNAGVVAQKDLPRLDDALADTARLRDSQLIELLLLVATLVLMALVTYATPVEGLPAWNYTRSQHGRSLAGWWQMLISVPLLLVIVWGWIWRLILWCVLLYRVARLDLLLPPVHPDGAAGLKFFSLSLQAWTMVAFGLAMTFAGTIATQVIYHGASIFDYRYFIGGFAFAVTILFTLPLFVFVPKLLEARRLGILHYGGLARAFGSEFEAEWLYRTTPLGNEARRDGIFSTTTDYYSIAAYAYKMSIIPVSLVDVAALLIASLLPFVPIVLMSVPAAVILEQVKQLLF